jgi:hypothetical protein
MHLRVSDAFPEPQADLPRSGSRVAGARRCAREGGASPGYALRVVGPQGMMGATGHSPTFAGVHWPASHCRRASCTSRLGGCFRTVASVRTCWAMERGMRTLQRTDRSPVARGAGGWSLPAVCP